MIYPSPGGLGLLINKIFRFLFTILCFSFLFSVYSFPFSIDKIMMSMMMYKRFLENLGNLVLSSSSLAVSEVDSPPSHPHWAQSVCLPNPVSMEPNIRKPILWKCFKSQHFKVARCIVNYSGPVPARSVAPLHRSRGSCQRSGISKLPNSQRLSSCPCALAIPKFPNLYSRLHFPLQRVFGYSSCCIPAVLGRMLRTLWHVEGRTELWAEGGRPP